MEPVLAQLRDRIVAAHAAKTPLRLRGGGTKDFYGEQLNGEILDTRAHAGIVDYEPSELVITARCGTALSQIDATLARHGQFLAFEPPAFGGDPTIGGVVAAGLSGPRRMSAGAARDFVLGASLLNARGELLHFGGQVMKNVAGFDVSRVLCGSLGILGLITQVSLKVLPRPRAEATLQIECAAAVALARFNAWRAQPLPISAATWHAGIASVRLAGAPSAVRSARDAIGGEALDETRSEAWWRSLRDQTLPLFCQDAPRLWRLSLPATAPLDIAGADLIEWAGALRWLRSDAPAGEIRALAERAGGTAAQWHGERNGPMFHPLAPATLELHRRLKNEFDPHAIFNRGRLVAEL
ncbi:MAG TPA: glycolate oxidase subunit GlcE [Rhodanobacteraceae bacterium]|nr:glycolate oxidase subunit GlcE [Rhodanobacteraceae bacterium]